MNRDEQQLAPIALFVYMRPDHTLRVLHCLEQCAEFRQSQVYVFCDGAKNNAAIDAVEATRAIVKDYSHPQITIIESDKNLGLANSIIHGVSRLCNEYGQVIVLEDDLTVSSDFLAFMNLALEKYRSCEQVMQVSGYMFPVTVSKETDAFFMPFTTSWGWATWDRAWQKFDPEMNSYEKISKDSKVKKIFNLGGAYDYFNLLKLQRSGKIDSWAIRWYLSVFVENGLTLYPAKTLVENHGLDGSGTHCGDEDPFRAYIDSAFSVKRWPSEVKVSENWPKVASFIGSCNVYGHGIRSKLKRLIKKIAF